MTIVLRFFEKSVVYLVLNLVGRGPRSDAEVLRGPFDGVYGMLNIYIFSLIFLFAPSYNQGAYEIGLANSEEKDDSHG